MNQSNRKLPLLYATHRPDLIQIPIVLHEDIPNGYGTHKNVWKNINQSGITWKVKKGGTTILVHKKSHPNF